MVNRHRLNLWRLNYRHVFPDILLLVLSIYLSLLLRVGWSGLEIYFSPISKYLLIFVGIRIAVFAVMGVYDIIWRYVSATDALKLAKSVALSTVFIMAASYAVDLARLPRSVFLIDMILSAVLLSGIRLGRRLAFEGSSTRPLQEMGRLALIYGAGANGRTLVHRFHTDVQLGYQVVGFIDDDLQKLGRLIGGTRVLGTGDDLEAILKSYRIQELVIAATRISGEKLRDVIQLARSLGIRPRLVMKNSMSTSKDKAFEIVRNIELGDLLNRPSNNVDLSSVREMIENRRVLITGAGGSIGSELARQIFNLKPSRLVLLEHSEFNLYQIDQELRVSPSDTSLIVPVLADIKDEKSLDNAFREYMPEIVFHAAAYKHVHLAESNPHTTILNNILGTKNLLQVCERNDVQTFVLISTDKAVNPAGIMGATKRVCEMLVAIAGDRLKRRYCSVRFGNVLGSSGSLIPLLQKQIESGEPVTITHPDITRYFMLIPEAVSLVLKASGIANPGDINVLKMGEPIKILDVAKSLIALMGRTEEESPILFTGLRPGEKMYEELYLCGNELNTSDPDILVIPKGDYKGEMTLNEKAFMEKVATILSLAEKADKDAIHELLSLVLMTGSKPMGSSLGAEIKPFTRPGIVSS